MSTKVLLAGRSPGQASGATAEEYLAATKGVALLDYSSLGKLRVEGKDGLDLLNRLSTNKIIELKVGEGVPTVLTTAKARVIDLITVLVMEDHLLVLTSAPKTVARWIDDYTFGEEIRVKEVTRLLGALAVLGPRAPEALTRLSQGATEGLEPGQHVSFSSNETKVIAYREPNLGHVPRFLLVAPKGELARVRSALLKGEPPSQRIGPEAWEMVRTEAGFPAYGRELTESINPWEGLLDQFISMDKGCYIGQEVIARLNTYRKVQRHLRVLKFSRGAAAPSPGTPLQVDGIEVGHITSVAVSPVGRRVVALGFVKAAYAKQGTKVWVVSDGIRQEAKVFRPPFWRPGTSTL